jgi:hypothetical protein
MLLHTPPLQRLGDDGLEVSFCEIDWAMNLASMSTLARVAPDDCGALGLSVVIATHNASDVVATCLAALEAQCSPNLREIIVADSSQDGTDAIVRTHFPEVTLLHFPEALSLPQLRAHGIAAATGAVIAIIDPYSIVEPRWADEVVAAHQRRPNLAIGGTVDLHDADRQRVLAWAQYINEYGMFMPPASEGEVGILPGSNISYKRAALEGDEALAAGAFWKTFANERVAHAGSGLWLSPRIRVALNKPIAFADFFRTRFDHGRCYAAMRVAQRSHAERWLRAVSSPALPIVLLWRTGSRYWAKRHRRDKLLLTLPVQLLLFASWSWGEFVGYVAGPGTSCARLFY